MAKPTQTRILDTLNYIQNNIGIAERNEVNNALPAPGLPAYNQISQNISLGFHIGGDVNQRHALRALLLCHQVFITNVGVRNLETQNARQAHTNASQAALQQRIRSWFTLTNGNEANVCQLARANRAAMPLWNNNTLDFRNLVRGTMPNQQFNCYNALVFWAFQGGAISLRWIWNQWYPAANNFALQTTALLPAPVAALPPLDGIGEHPVPQAHVVVMQRAGNPLGHTVMSIGNGLCISQNNKAMLPNAADGEATTAKQAHATAAINDCNNSRCHEISIRFLVGQYYPPAQGYTPQHHPPFWLSYPANAR